MKINILKVKRNQFLILTGIALFIVSALTSCSVTPEIADIKLDHSDPRLVVEGLVTDQPGPYFVKLSLTGSYYEKEIVRVNDATVVITDNKGNKDVLTRTGEGVYETDSLLGEIGNTYHLTVHYEGGLYTSTSILTSGITIDSMSTIFQEESIVMDEGYYVTLFGKEPKDDENYYRWYITKNDTLDSDIILSDDLFFDSEIDGLMIDRTFKKGDKAKVEVHSLTKEEYKYFIGLSNIVNSDGGFFSSPPKNPKGNITNGALGIFKASKVSSKEIIVE